MFKSLKNLIPHRVKRAVRQVMNPPRQTPELHYVELHLTDHCNMACKGCGHYCPIARPRYAKRWRHRRDMRRLSQLFRNIRQIRLMGGEPLLHPDPASFIRITRKFFPKTDLRFVTNGLLLPQAASDFWAACREAGAVIDMTVYPPMKSRVAELRVLCEQNQVTLETREVETFFSHRDLSGNSDREKAFELCRQRYFCPYLEKGRIYTCAMSSQIHHFNKRFGFRVPRSKGLNIYAPFLSGRDVKKYLAQPVETCEWCAYEPVEFDWKAGQQLPQEWFPEMTPES